MVFGAFDGFHPGHLHFFKEAKKYGDYLIVSVGTDKNVHKIKGKKPLFCQDKRVELAGALKIVDKCILGAETEFYKEIKRIAPDVICLGYDQWGTTRGVKDGLAKVGLTNVEVVRLKPYKKKTAKSTILKKRSVDL